MTWQRKKLGNIATFINGKAFKPSDWSDAGLPIIRIQNLTNSIDDIHYYNGDIEEKYRITTGDILISWSATIDVFEWLNGDAVLNQHIFKVVFDKEPIDKTFFKHLIKQKIDEMLKNVHGSTMKHITKGDFDNIDVLLPSLDEQKKIAKILDKADEIRAKKKLANDKLDEFLKSTFISMFGDPVKNDKSLPIAKVGGLTTLVSSGSTPLGGSSVYQDEGVLFIRSQNVLMNKFDFTDIAHISDEIYNSMARTQVQMNDVLLNITGASIGRIHRYMFKDKANVNQHVCIIRPILDKVSPVYLEYCIGNSNYQHNILRQNSGATRQAFNFEQIKGFKIPLPPIEDQNKFAKIVEKVEAQKQKNEEVIEQMDNLFNSLSQRAFKGEL